MSSHKWQGSEDLLAALIAKPRFGLFSDLDGTLSSIAPTPEAAQITQRNRELLTELQKLLPLVAIISGRRADNVHQLFGLSGIVYVGNHGLERWVEGSVQVIPEALPYLRWIQAARKDLEKISEPGVYIEDKGPTLSFHYRQTAKPIAFARNHAASLAQIAGENKLELFTGKMVFEFRPPVAMHKGIAFRRLVEEKRIDAALFLGDDVSDVNAFKAARQMRADGVCDAWGVGVQSKEAPEALADTVDFLADGVEDVEDLLSWLLKARWASST